MQPELVPGLESAPYFEFSQFKCTWCKKGIVKSRMLTGVYNFQQPNSRFSKIPTCPKCNLCRQEEENLMHTFTRCPVFPEERVACVNQMKE